MAKAMRDSSPPEAPCAIGRDGLVLVTLAGAILTHHWAWLWLLPVLGYGFAWVGHFFFEKNRPATFKYPGFSLMGDFRLWFEVVTLQRKF